MTTHSISYISEANAESRGYGATRDYGVGGEHYPGVWVLEADGKFVRNLHVDTGIKSFWAGQVNEAKHQAAGYITPDEDDLVVWEPTGWWCPARDWTARFVDA